MNIHRQERRVLEAGQVFVAEPSEKLQEAFLRKGLQQQRTSILCQDAADGQLMGFVISERYFRKLCRKRRAYPESGLGFSRAFVPDAGTNLVEVGQDRIAIYDGSRETTRHGVSLSSSPTSRQKLRLNYGKPLVTVSV